MTDLILLQNLLIASVVTAILVAGYVFSTRWFAMRRVQADRLAQEIRERQRMTAVLLMSDRRKP